MSQDALFRDTRKQDWFPRQARIHTDIFYMIQIKRIKLYQDLGLKIKEIKEIIDAPNPVLKKILEERIVKMEEEKERIDDLVDKVKQLIATLS